MKKFIFYIPTVLFAIIFGGLAIIGGTSSVSPIVIVWIGLFLVGGFILNQYKPWGAIFGMLPGIHLIYMSTKDTGQAIDIELPLGLIVLFFYIFCGIYVYRKNKIRAWS